MVESRQKNLKLPEHSIELLKFLAYLSDSTESEVVERALVNDIALSIAEKLRTANLHPVDDAEGVSVVEARYMALRLQRHDPKFHWRVVQNDRGQWELQHAEYDGQDIDEVDENEWKPWPWPGATRRETEHEEIEVEEIDNEGEILDLVEEDVE